MEQVVRGRLRRRPVLATVATLATALLTACGAVAAGHPSPAGNAQPTVASPPAGQLTSPQPPRLTPLVVRDQDNGHTISIRVGERVAVVLASTYWRLDGSSDPAVLRQLTEATMSPQPSGCVPGQGCGTVSALFDAVAAGRADVTAKRTSCGEAMSCTGNLGLYRVTVVVAG
ncbi:MAG TPA: hypothetical protein VGO86_07035 [Candidatus Dormibacteraeota bacterium]